MGRQAAYPPQPPAPATVISTLNGTLPSMQDLVLKTVYGIAEFDTALGLRGPEDPHDMIAHSAPTDAATTNDFVVNFYKHIRKHGAYKRADLVYDDISSFSLLSGTVRDQYETLPN